MANDVADESGCYLVAGLPSSGIQRLDALQVYGLLEPSAEQALNELARLAALCCEAPIALISLSNRDTKWARPLGKEVNCREHRLPFCAHTIAAPASVMVIPDARHDARFASHPLVTAQQGILFFAVTPLLAPTGESVGALCIADYKPRDLTELQCQMLLGLTSQMVEQLHLHGSIQLLEAKISGQARFMEQLKREQQELQKQNATDPLTGLGNRRSFHDRLCLEIARAEFTDTTLALMMFDVDYFKSYNDSYGHPAGDVVLKLLADVVLQSCREEDFAARVGGEEFAVLLPGTSSDDAVIFANWLRRRVQRQLWPHRPVTISGGVAVAANRESGLQLAARADIALYRAKRDGRNRITLSETPLPV